MIGGVHVCGRRTRVAAGVERLLVEMVGWWLPGLCGAVLVFVQCGVYGEGGGARCGNVLLRWWGCELWQRERE